MRSRVCGTAWVNIAIIAIAAFVYTALVSPASVMTAGRRSSPVYRSPGDDTALIIAVSWDAEAVKEVLDTLHARDERVTFAVSGRFAEEEPVLLRRIADEGHEIASMGYDPNRELYGDELKGDILRSLDIIERITGERPSLFYCGSGYGTAPAANELGLTAVRGTADLDCGRGTAFDIESRLCSLSLKGAIITAQPTAAFRDALPFLLEKIKKLGSSIVTIHKMLYN